MCICTYTNYLNLGIKIILLFSEIRICVFLPPCGNFEKCLYHRNDSCHLSMEMFKPLKSPEFIIHPICKTDRFFF